MIIRKIRNKILKRKEKRKKIYYSKVIASIILGIVCVVLTFVGVYFGRRDDSSNSAWYILVFMAFIPFVSIILIWLKDYRKKKGIFGFLYRKY